WAVSLSLGASVWVVDFSLCQTQHQFKKHKHTPYTPHTRTILHTSRLTTSHPQPTTPLTRQQLNNLFYTYHAHSTILFTLCP
ncbi:hypothetical protein B0J11DRAFT_478845, partial [Dendryphion nanum]